MTGRRLTWMAAGALVLAVAATLGGAAGAGFTFLDDSMYVTANRHVLAGLTWEGVRWVLGPSAVQETYFQPLTWLSLMLDVQVFGPEPVALHLVNLALHAAVVVLLFLVTRRATGRPGPALAAALLFAVHPLHAESVAWVAERKQVLGAALGLGAALAWLVHAGPPPGRRSPWSAALAAALLAASLLAKPTFVVMPALLLLLDFWPLGRLRPGGAAAGGAAGPPRASPLALVAEKWPLWAVCAAVAAVVLTRLPAVAPYAARPPDLPLRLANALATVPAYLGAVILPRDLTILRPFPEAVPAGAVALGTALAAGLTAGALLLARRRPWLLVGWLWFLAALAPVSGLFQTGVWPAWADRFAYVPMMGLALAAAFEGAEWARQGPRARAAALAALGVAVAALGLATRAQVALWHTPSALFARAAAQAPAHAGVRTMYAQTLRNEGQLEEAMAQLGEARRLDPGNLDAMLRAAETLHLLGRPDESREAFRQVLHFVPDLAEAHMGVGFVAWEQGRTDEARYHLERFLQLAGGEAPHADSARTWLAGLARAPAGTPAPLP